jgi:hypothetical protein
MAIMLDYGGCKKVNMKRKMGVKGENEVALLFKDIVNRNY